MGVKEYHSINSSSRRSSLGSNENKAKSSRYIRMTSFEEEEDSSSSSDSDGEKEGNTKYKAGDIKLGDSGDKKGSSSGDRKQFVSTSSAIPHDRRRQSSTLRRGSSERNFSKKPSRGSSNRLHRRPSVDDSNIVFEDEKQRRSSLESLRRSSDLRNSLQPNSSINERPKSLSKSLGAKKYHEHFTESERRSSLDSNKEKAKSSRHNRMSSFEEEDGLSSSDSDDDKKRDHEPTETRRERRQGTRRGVLRRESDPTASFTSQSKPKRLSLEKQIPVSRRDPHHLQMYLTGGEK